MVTCDHYVNAWREGLRAHLHQTPVEVRGTCFHIQSAILNGKAPWKLHLNFLYRCSPSWPGLSEPVSIIANSKVTVS